MTDYQRQAYIAMWFFGAVRVVLVSSLILWWAIRKMRSTTNIDPH